MLLKELKKSIPVKSKTLQSVTSKSLLILSMMSINAQADTFYKDYVSEQLQDYVNKQVEVLGKFNEVKIRESLGCPTGELRAELGGILRHSVIKGHKLDMEDKKYAQNVDDIVIADYYKNSGQCGIVEGVIESEPNKVNVEGYLSKKIAQTETVRKQLNLTTVRKKLDI